MIKEEDKQQLEEYRYLVDNVPDPLAVVDMLGRFLFVSFQFEKITGYSAKEIIGKSILGFSFFHKEHIPQLLKNLKDRMLGRSVPVHDIEVYVRGKKKIIAQINGTTIQFRGKKAFLFSLRDVTEQRAIEKKLSESEKRFSDIMLNTSDFIWEVDKNGKYTYISEKVKNILGYTPKEMIGKTPFDFMIKEEARNNKKMFAGISKRRGNIIDLENVNLHKKGNYVTLLTNAVPIMGLSGNFLGYRGVDKDISEKKRVEEKYRTIFMFSRDAIMTLFPPDWKFASANPATIKMFGARDEEEFTSKHPEDLSPAKQPNGKSSSTEAKKMIAKAMKDGSVSFEWTHRKIDGQTFLASVVLTRVKSYDKIFLQATVRDITEQKRNEQFRLEHQEETEKMNRLMVGRELKMIELKEKIKKIEAEIKNK